MEKQELVRLAIFQEEKYNQLKYAVQNLLDNVEECEFDGYLGCVGSAELFNELSELVE